MVLRLRLVYCLCLTTATSSSRLEALILASRTTNPLYYAAANYSPTHNYRRHQRHAQQQGSSTRSLMTSKQADDDTTCDAAAADSNVNVGQADIGKKTMAGSGNEGSQDGGSAVLPEKSWRQLLEVSCAKTRKIRGSNYVQIATVDNNNEPRCRTVVFRGFVNLNKEHPLASYDNNKNLSCVMKMITDLRSDKVSQVENNPKAEMVWWFPKTSEQYRIRGDLLFVGGGGSSTGGFKYDNDRDLAISRKEQWGNLSDAARESFLKPEMPGADYEIPASSVPKGGRDADTGHVLQPPPKNFLLMLLIPNYCDYLNLTNMYHQIDQKQQQQQQQQQQPDSDEWTSKRVNP